VFPGTARNLLLSLGGVIQEPDTDFTISGSTLTFTTPPVANTTFFGVIYGDMQATGTPSDGTVLPASIASSGNFSFPQVTINESGADVDFRVESDTNTHALFLNAGNSRVGINTASPNDELEVTGNVQVTSGNLKVTSSNPGIRFTDSDASGGFGHVGVNNTSGSLVLRSDDGNSLSGSFMGFEIDGQPKMYLDADGRFLIGATSSVSSTAMLQTKRANNNTILISNSDATATNFTAVDFAPANNTIGSRIVSKAIGTFGNTSSETADLFFETIHQGTSEKRLYIDSTGLIGIGTDSPSNIIHATGSNSSTGYQFINTHATDGFGVRIAGGGTTADRYALRVDNAASEEKFRINANGNVGVGTDSPDQLLHLSSTGTCKLRLEDKRTSISNTSQYGVIQFEQRDSNTPGVSIEVAAVMEDTSNGASGLQIKTGTPSTIDERFRIDRSGNLLIGRTAWVDNHFDNGIYLAGSTQAGMKFMRTASGSAGTYDIGIDTDNAFKFVYAGDSGGTGTERMRITSDGRMMINSTAVTNTHDQLTVKRVAASFGEMSLTVDANTTTDSAANAFLFAKSKHTYWAGYGFQTNDGHIGAIVGRRDASASDANTEIRVEIGGTHINQSEERTWNFKKTGDLSISDGNLVVANGHGIDFSATGNGGSSPTGVSELFNDYETGTFTVTLANSLSVHTQTKLTYTKIGNKCHISGQFRINTGGSDLTINNLPFTTVSTGTTDETFSVGFVGLYYVTMPTDGNASGEIYSKTQKNDNNIFFMYNRTGNDPNQHTATANGYYTISHWYTVFT
jgi:hypothetical protein